MIHKKFLPKIKKTSQTRSENSLNDILESADAIFDENDHTKLNARSLADKSGYSIGTLYYYLNKAEDAFILMIFRRRERQFHHLANLISTFPEDKPLRELLEMMIDSGFKEFNRMNSKSFLVIFRMILRFSKNPFVFDDALSYLVTPFIEAGKRNTTGTFRKLEADEYLLVLKAIFTLIRRPFFEQSPFAGTQKHRDLVVDSMERLLGTRL